MLSVTWKDDIPNVRMSTHEKYYQLNTLHTLGSYRTLIVFKNVVINIKSWLLDFLGVNKIHT